MSQISCTKCRREGEKLFIKGEKCSSPKCPLTRKSYGPGQHGSTFTRRRVSEYGEQLREKQKVKRIYNVREKQFRNYFKKAAKSGGIRGEMLLRLLEKRLNNVIFRLGFTDSRSAARQMVSHGHITVNDKKVNISSFQVKINDVIALSPKFKKNDNVKIISERLQLYKTPSWLKLDAKKIEGKVVSEPKREEMDANINESLIVEFYSR
ncbi:30S ribosomal protein S4 [bacterium CG_4_10_14_0_2_um_filter_33_32]|nr:MAG: 30S ribosomal protein S4 [bacterium CG2_30_33_46]PIR67383.1 MAG: 30S ribosomal protein S4 [bacterium CG10_big_fil_rev_8_21_14_0_10_33_18]PIU76771.1 MAG: 30S ribosomal protein S4 [bacterium CG06_land_8_20_14_3_00_33_50]PIW81284.1 MAG: 30S ribosomal protein S4 [bacterium CG_4_8_14_3_um_filter_33_28]PIY85727.1 MAG: 30S ribosomal protein S4 [bacterium CG_4_10_14_0_8_um_filter_33_57]PIZ86570.1 MAG: 30S ribosomal protein S4 [bacterium CG_4_10_14_0_2_um_filter_33_32]PJA72099.1 MAG: 30S ribos